MKHDVANTEMGVNVQTLPHRSVNVEPIVSIMEAVLCSRAVRGGQSISGIPHATQLIPLC